MSREGKELEWARREGGSVTGQTWESRERAGPASEIWFGFPGRFGLGQVGVLGSFLLSSFLFKPHSTNLDSNSNLNSTLTLNQIKLCTSMHAQHVEPKINFSYLWNKN